ncbi:MAG: Phosphoenolpyruvate synthase, partial [Candidatus Moranbacteria bacterium GW2011_GWF2_35_39]
MFKKNKQTSASSAGKKNKKDAFVLWFKELGIEDIEFGGGKNASL